MLKGYLLFCGFHDAESKGWDDYNGQYDTEEDAEADGRDMIKQRNATWWQVVNIETQQICRESQ